MLRHRLSDPIKRDYQEIEFAKYVAIHKGQTEPTDPDFFTKLKEEYYAAHSSIEQSKLNKVWGLIAPKISENRGLAEFTRDYQGHLSDYFFPWLINVFRSPATALEMSYGAGPDLNEDWHDDILSTEDPIVPFIKDDPAFVYNRERQLYVADLASSVVDLAAGREDPAKIVDFGSGRLTWIRNHGFIPSKDRVEIYAFDQDPSIRPDQLFSSDPEELGIRFKHGNFTAQFNNPDCRNADLIILGGVVSYIPAAKFIDGIIPAIYQLLNDVGVFFFDLQIDCPCYQHSMDILSWPKFDLPASTNEAIARVEEWRKSLWSSGIKFSAEYTTDTYNELPSGIMVTMQKVT